jgi:molecular chaperone DnaK
MRIGVDLGEHSSKAAFMPPNGQPVMVADAQLKDNTAVRSVFLPIHSGLLVGDFAWYLTDAWPMAPEPVRYNPDLLANVPEPTEASGPRLPETLAALMLKKLKADTETMTASNLSGAVMTVPYHLTTQQQQALRLAGQLANLPVLELLPEPEAVAIYYQPAASKPFVVLCWGNNRLAVSVMQRHQEHYRVVAHQTRQNMGGLNWDKALARVVLNRYEQTAQETNPPVALSDGLLRAVEAAKIALSGEVAVRQSFLVNQQVREVILTQADLLPLLRPDLVDATQTVLACLQEAGLQPDEVDEVLLAGGSTLIPAVRQWAGRLFAQHAVCYDTNRLNAAVLGAARRAIRLDASLIQPATSGVMPHHIGVRILNPTTRQPTVDTVIGQHQPLPTRAKRVYYSTGPNQPYIYLDIVRFSGTDSNLAEPVGRLSIGPLTAQYANYAVEVTFLCDDDGTLSLTAYDPETGHELAQHFQSESTAGFPVARQRQLVRSTVVNGLY